MFKLSSSDRLGRWKQFRSELNSQSIDQAVQSVMSFWQSCPFIPFYLIAEDSSNWPDPWQLITENYYCDLAKTLGIVYTLHLTDHSNTIDPEIRVYYDTKKRVHYHIAWLCQGKYILNLIEGEIVNNTHINQQLKLKYCYTAVDLKLEQY